MNEAVKRATDMINSPIEPAKRTHWTDEEDFNNLRDFLIWLDACPVELADAHWEALNSRITDLIEECGLLEHYSAEMAYDQEGVTIKPVVALWVYDAADDKKVELRVKPS